MLEFLRDAYGHQAWADAQHWIALESHPGALDDSEICQRLYHLHLTQRAFLLIVCKEQLVLKRFEDFPSMKALKEYAINNHNQAAAFLQNSSESNLGELAVIPWFKDPPIRVTVAQALMQAAMHSHYHRAQNARRLRELGGQPPLTDLIAWYWKGRPTAQWT